MSVAVTCAAQPAPAPAHAEPKDTCPLPLAGPARPGHPYPETCSGVMQCLHVDAQSGAYSVKDSAPIPELREGDVLIKVSWFRNSGQSTLGGGRNSHIKELRDLFLERTLEGEVKQ